MIDRKILVIGSMNLDPRSAHLTTDLTLAIHSAAIASQVAQLFDHAIAPGVSYRVSLATLAPLVQQKAIGAPQSLLVWHGEENGLPHTTSIHRQVCTGMC